MNLHRKKRKRRRRNRIQSVCMFIIKLCIIAIVACGGMALFYSIPKSKSQNTDLMQEMDEIAKYYEKQKASGDDNVGNSDGEGELRILNQLDDAPNSPEKGETEEVISIAEESKIAEEDNVTEEDNATEEIAEELNSQDQISYGQEEKSEREKKLRKLINSAPLNPRNPDDAELAACLDDLMPEITDGCEDTYEKVKACYDFLIDNCSYSKTVKYTYEQDAYLLLTYFRGSCTYYAAAFHYMMCYIGLDDRIISGYRYLHSDRCFHRWNEITIDGIPYVFDTQWEENLIDADNGIRYKRFCMSHEEVKMYYDF